MRRVSTVVVAFLVLFGGTRAADANPFRITASTLNFFAFGDFRWEMSGPADWPFYFFAEGQGWPLFCDPCEGGHSSSSITVRTDFLGYSVFDPTGAYGRDWNDLSETRGAGIVGTVTLQNQFRYPTLADLEQNGSDFQRQHTPFTFTGSLHYPTQRDGSWPCVDSGCQEIALVGGGDASALFWGTQTSNGVRLVGMDFEFKESAAPIPEPSTFVLTMTMAGIGIAALRWRRRATDK